MTSDSASAGSSRSKGPALASATTARSFGLPSGRQPGARRRRPQQAQSHPAERERWPAWAATVRARGARSPRWTGGGPAGAAVEHEPRAERADDLERHPLVVRLGVGDQQRVEPLHPGLGEPAQDRAAGRPGVDEQRAAVALEQRRVALADVEERDDQLARAAAGPAVEAGEHERGEPRGATRRGDGAAVGAAAARPAPRRRDGARPAAPPA